MSHASQTPQAVSPPDSGLASVGTTLDIIELLANAAQPLRLTDIARTLRLSKARAHRHLRALAQRGYARQDMETDRYRAGIRVLTLGEQVREQFGVVAAARAEMALLRQETGQAVTLSALTEDGVMILDLLQGRSVIEFGFRPGSILSLHAAAHGKVALAFGPGFLWDKMRADGLARFTPQTCTNLETLRQELGIIRKQGWASAPNQLLPGVNTLAAPIFDHRQGWVGTLAIVGSVQAMPPVPHTAMLRSLCAAAARASLALGHSA